MSDDSSRQVLEIEALQSIHEELKFDAEKCVGVIYIYPEKTEKKVKNTKKCKNMEKPTLMYLPPVKFEFKLRPDYPSTDYPLISLSSCWLPVEELEKIVANLEEFYHEEILFQWITQIKVYFFCFYESRRILEVSKN